MVLFLIHNQSLCLLNRMSCDIALQRFHHWRLSTSTNKGQCLSKECNDNPERSIGRVEYVRDIQRSPVFRISKLRFHSLASCLRTYQRKHSHQLRCQCAKTGGNQMQGTGRTPCVCISFLGRKPWSATPLKKLISARAQGMSLLSCNSRCLDVCSVGINISVSEILSLALFKCFSHWDAWTSSKHTTPQS